MSRVPAVMVVGNWLITNDGRGCCCWLVQGPRPLDLGTLSYPLSPPGADLVYSGRYEDSLRGRIYHSQIRLPRQRDISSGSALDECATYHLNHDIMKFQGIVSSARRVNGARGLWANF